MAKAKDAIELITADHREVERMLDQLRSGKGDPSPLTDEVGLLLIAHSRAEEEHVYPVVAKEAPGGKDQVRHSKEEHHQVEQLVRRLRDTDPGSEDFPPLVERLIEAVTEHVETEESQVLPALNEAVSAERLRELGADFSRRRTEVLDQLESGGEGKDRPSRDELYRKAQEADIPRRSKMTKDELAQALREDENEDEQ